MSENIVVTNDVDQHRFVLTVDGVEAGFAAYRQHDAARDFNHTVVYDDFQGKGLSKPLIKAALDETQADGQKIIATCSAVERFVEKNPEYQS